MSMYLLISSDEDGNPIKLLNAADLKGLLGDPVEAYGVRKFETADFLQSHPDPNYWPGDTAVLLRADAVVPEPVTSQWEIRP